MCKDRNYFAIAVLFSMSFWFKKIVHILFAHGNLPDPYKAVLAPKNKYYHPWLFIVEVAANGMNLKVYRKVLVKVGIWMIRKHTLIYPKSNVEKACHAKR